MNSISVVNGQAVCIEVIDALKDIMLYIYEVDKKFAFRYMARDRFSGNKIDPIFNSTDFTWANGPHSSVEQAKDAAHQYYINYGHYQIPKVSKTGTK